MATIATLSVGLGINAAGFTSGMDAGRKSSDLFSGSLKSAQSVMTMTRTAGERYEAQLKTLSNHLDHGRIDLETYTRALASVEAGYKKAQAAADAARGGGFNLGNALGAFGGAALLESGIEKIKTAAEGAAQKSHRAEMIGITAEDMGKLEHAAKMTETPIDALTTGVGKLQKNLGELAMGRASKDFVEGLKQLQLDPKKLIGQDAIGQLMEIAQGLSRIENPSKRAAAAMAIVGRGGLELVPFLMQGKDAIRALGDEAARMGVALNNADSQKMTDAAHGFARAQEAASGALNRGVVALSPYILKVTEFVTAHQHSSTAALAGSIAVGGLAIAYNTLAPGMSAALSAAQKMGPAFTAGAVGAGLLAVQLARMAATGEDWSTAALHNIDPFLQGIASSGRDATLGARYKVATTGTDVLNRIGALRLDLSLAPGNIANAPDVQTKADLTREALSKMQELLALQKAYQTDIGKLGQFNSATMVTDKMVQATRDKIHTLQDMLDKFNAENAKRRFGSDVNIVDPEVTKATEALQEYIVKLREEWAALQSTTAEAKIYALEHASHASGLAAEARGLAELTAGFKAQAKAMEDLEGFYRRIQSRNLSGGDPEQAEFAAKTIAAVQGAGRALGAALADLGRGNLSGLSETADALHVAFIRLPADISATAAELKKIADEKSARTMAEEFQRMRDKILEATAALRGLSEAQRMLDAFARKNPGQTDKIAEFAKLADQLGAMTELQKQVEKAKQLAESGQTAQQKYAENINALNAALLHGAIGWNQYADGVKRAKEELQKAGSARAQALGTYDPANISLAGLALGSNIPDAGADLPRLPEKLDHVLKDFLLDLRFLLMDLKSGIGGIIGIGGLLHATERGAGAIMGALLGARAALGGAALGVAHGAPLGAPAVDISGITPDELDAIRSGLIGADWFVADKSLIGEEAYNNAISALKGKGSRGQGGAGDSSNPQTDPIMQQIYEVLLQIRNNGSGLVN